MSLDEVLDGRPAATPPMLLDPAAAVELYLAVQEWIAQARTRLRAALKAAGGNPMRRNYGGTILEDRAK